MTRLTTFLDLPAEIHSHVAHYLPVQSLISLSCLNRTAQALYANEASARVFLDGNHEMTTFHRRLSPQVKRLRCHHSAPCPADGIDLSSTPPKKRLRAERIKEVSIYDLRHGNETDLSDAPEPQDAINSIAVKREFISVTRLSNTLSVCPNLQALQVYQSSVALSPLAASTISSRTPQLRSLTFRSPHCDAASLAGLLRKLERLHTLEVFSVKTCPCRGHVGLVHGAIELGLALRSHPKLHRIVFNSSKVLSVDDGLLLRVLSGEDKYTCEHKEALRIRHREQHQHHHIGHLHDHHTASTPPASPNLLLQEGPSMRLRSIEFRRSPLHGRALMRYLRSAPAAQLDHLFIGGCKHVRPGHLILATQDMCPHSGLTSSSEPLQLEVDGRLLSKELLRNLSHRITLLRIFEPADEHLKIVAHVLKSGGLHRLTDLVILPREDDLHRWAPLSPHIASLIEDTYDDQPTNGDLRKYMHSQLALLGDRRPVDLTVGDEAWQAMQQCKSELRWWAQLQHEQEQEEMRRASLSHDGDGEHADDKADVDVPVDWSGGGIDVWR